MCPCCIRCVIVYCYQKFNFARVVVVYIANSLGIKCIIHYILFLDKVCNININYDDLWFYFKFICGVSVVGQKISLPSIASH